MTVLLTVRVVVVCTVCVLGDGLDDDTTGTDCFGVVVRDVLLLVDEMMGVDCFGVVAGVVLLLTNGTDCPGVVAGVVLLLTDEMTGVDCSGVVAGAVLWRVDEMTGTDCLGPVAGTVLWLLKVVTSVIQEVVTPVTGEVQVVFDPGQLVTVLTDVAMVVTMVCGTGFVVLGMEYTQEVEAGIVNYIKVSAMNLVPMHKKEYVRYRSSSSHALCTRSKACTWI